MKKSLPVFLLLTLCFFFTSFSQDYSTAIGLRAGSANGLSVKQFVGYSTAVEGLFVYRRGGLRGIALVKQHFSLGRRSNTNAFIGIGGHYGANYLIVGDLAPRKVYGIDFIAGLEYVFPHSDFAVSLDIKPMLEMHGKVTVSGNNTGVSIRYIIN